MKTLLGQKIEPVTSGATSCLTAKYHMMLKAGREVMDNDFFYRDFDDIYTALVLRLYLNEKL